MIAAVVEKGAGIDVHKKFLKVCVRIGPLSEEPRFEIRRVECSHSALEGLRQWLKAEGVTHIVMESTGPYWVPVFNILEQDVKVILANPEQVKNRKGHKTDAQDSWWLAHLLRHGMIRASFIPEKATRNLRELTRRRKKLIEQAASERNRVQKQLEYGNVKLGNELSDVFGLSGQMMLQALVNEDRTPEEIAELAQGSLQKKKKEIAEAVRGQRLNETQKEVIRSGMRLMVFLDLESEALSVSIAKLIQESGQQKQKELLETIPGIGEEAAGNVLAETGPDMKQFPDEGHLSSWGGVCSGDNESAGNNKSRHTTHGNPWLRATLTECAWSASRTKGTVFESRYESLKPKIGTRRRWWRWRICWRRRSTRCCHEGSNTEKGGLRSYPRPRDGASFGTMFAGCGGWGAGCSQTRLAVSSVLCKRFRISFVVKCLFLAPQADGGCGKVGIPLLDFHFSTAPH